MFELTHEEVDLMVSQNVIPSKSWFGGALPMAFTEQGVAMLSGILTSERAIAVNIAIMRAFVQLRRWIRSNEELYQKIEQMEAHYDDQFRLVFETLQQLRQPEMPQRRPIGFKTAGKLAT